MMEEHAGGRGESVSSTLQCVALQVSSVVACLRSLGNGRRWSCQTASVAFSYFYLLTHNHRDKCHIAMQSQQKKVGSFVFAGFPLIKDVQMKKWGKPKEGQPN